MTNAPSYTPLLRRLRAQMDTMGEAEYMRVRRQLSQAYDLLHTVEDAVECAENYEGEEVGERL